jgi:CDP-6-deoxy-D-xylo-4-hexulose-3-dehydrase
VPYQKTRQENFAKQCEFFSKYEDLFSNPVEQHGANTAWLAFPILIKKEAPFSRRQFQIYLEERNIQTRVVFTGNVLRQPMCSNIEKRTIESGYPNSDSIMERGVLLPLHHGLTKDMFKRLHLTIEEFISNHT